MKNSFKKALNFILKWEGGYSNHPADSGGATNHGITQGVYAIHTKSTRDVKDITMKEVEDIYYTKYWCKSYCDYMPDPVATVAFDTAVNCGVHRAIKMLQQALNIHIDGIVGEYTMKAISTIDNPMEVAYSIIDIRSDFYMGLIEKKPSQKVFLKGWSNRLRDLTKAIKASQHTHDKICP